MFNELGYFVMAPMADYAARVEGFAPIKNKVINESIGTICYNLTIYDDNHMEDDELFSLTLIVQNGSAIITQVDPQLSSTIVKIVDDDGKL